jgi:hypothetical protein
MNFTCICGHVVSDSTDDLPHKARLVADEDWNLFTESLDWRLVSNLYQCSQCGRLRLEKPRGNVVFFEPENANVSKRLLGSVKEDERRS